MYQKQNTKKVSSENSSSFHMLHKWVAYLCFCKSFLQKALKSVTACPYICNFFADTRGCFANSSPHPETNSDLNGFLHVCFHIVDIVKTISSNIFCSVDTWRAKPGSGCLVIPWYSASGPIIPCPTSGWIAHAGNTLTLSASQVSNCTSPLTYFHMLFLISTLLWLP